MVFIPDTSSDNWTCLPLISFSFLEAFISLIKDEVAEQAAVYRTMELTSATAITKKLSVKEVMTASTQSWVGGPSERGLVR